MRIFKSLPLISIIFIFSCSYQKQCETNIRERSTDEEFAGIIKEVYFQFSDGGRGVPTIVLMNGTKYYSSTKRLICYATPGDSLIKKKGTLKYIVKRPDTTAVFYPNCGSIVILDSGKTAYEYYEFNDCGKTK